MSEWFLSKSKCPCYFLGQFAQPKCLAHLDWHYPRSAQRSDFLFIVALPKTSSLVPKREHSCCKASTFWLMQLLSHLAPRCASFVCQYTVHKDEQVSLSLQSNFTFSNVWSGNAELSYMPEIVNMVAEECVPFSARYIFREDIRKFTEIFIRQMKKSIYLEFLSKLLSFFSAYRLFFTKRAKFISLLAEIL